MLAILMITAAFALLGYSVWRFYLDDGLKKMKKSDTNAVYIIVIMAAAFIVRAVCAFKYHGHSTDMSCFSGWSGMLFSDGIPAFYHSDAFHDYPPGYMYILYLIGAIRHFLNLSGGANDFVVKLPAIIVDLLSGFFVYKLAGKKFNVKISALFAALYLFNPAVILNSSLWGQVDTVYTFLIAVMIYMISEKQMIKSYFIFALCIFIKPQAFIFTPLIIYGIIENVFLPKFNKDAFVKNLLFGLCAIAMIFVLAIPFGIGNVIQQYTITLSQYPHLTVNAFNIWGAFGQNWTDLNPFTTVLGYIILAAIVAFVTYIFFKSKDKSKYYFAGALLAFSTFMLSTKMHDRYAFPMMLLMLLALIETPRARNYALYIMLTLSQFFNTAWVLFIYEQDINLYFKSPVIVAASFVNIALYAYFIYISLTQYAQNKIAVYAAASSKVNKPGKTQLTKKSSNQAKETASVGFTPAKSKVLSKLTRADIIAMVVITAVYSCIALYDLGDMYAPQTHVSLTDNPVTVDLGADKEISQLKFYLGSERIYDGHPLDLEFRDSSNNVVHNEHYTSGSVFRWEEHKDINTTARYITLSTEGTDRMEINELALLDASGNLILPANASDTTVEAMFDEQEMVPERQTFRNSTYFDEIYHGRTGYEFVHSLPVYEWTHPPLGKVFIALGILIFGMCPFGWRIVGTVFGMIMVPIIYMFAKRFFNKTWLAIVTCLLFTFDFMHFAQTRIATIDVYVTFFIMLMYLFMYKYTTMSFYDTPLKKTFVPLALSGISFGLAFASKWTGLYAGAGLAIIFFLTLYRRYSEYLKAKKRPKEYKYIIDSFTPNMLKTLGWCCIFFVAVPIVIYCMSYIPYLQTPNSEGLKTILQNQESMYVYHSKTVLGSTHSFSSLWYEWIIMKRPIWYYSGTVSDGIKEGISSFGNPLVWWLGIPAFIYMVYIAIKKKDKRALFLVIAYLSQLVPWIPIKRLTYIYHYFPCVPFITMMIGYSIYLIYKEAKENNKKKVIYGAFVYSALVIVLFAMFYPVLSGQPCSVDYVNHFLKWFDSWVLI